MQDDLRPPADPSRDPEPDPADSGGALRRALSRRGFLKGAGGIAAGGALVGEAAAAPKPFSDPQVRAFRFDEAVPLELVVNGEAITIGCEPRTTLLELLRSRLPEPLTGTKEVCDRAACGACTVLLDGQPVYACNTLAVACYQREVTTVEGLGTPEAMSPVQAAFWQHDAAMCGFCTPGFVVSVTACLEANPEASVEELQDACAGNLCRCGTYPQIWAAARAAGPAVAARQEAERRAAEEATPAGPAVPGAGDGEGGR